MPDLDLLREGRLDEALAELKNQVRKDASNPKHRVFLFQMMAVQGEWDKALTQLNTLAELDPIALAMAQMYRTALDCEVLRSQVFAGARTPLIFGEPENWIALLAQALGHAARGEVAQAKKLQAQAFEDAPTTSGTINGEPFEWIADADSRLGPVLETIVNGGYYWIPFNRIHRIDIDPPEDLRDVVWMPAHFTWANGGEMVGVIPTRYAGSELSPESAIRLSRKTDWKDLGDDYFVGLGQRMFSTDAGDYSLMDARQIVFNAPQVEDVESTQNDE
jgi:type VI secretion system protein ImpE